jgi:hypothetical protein
VCRLSQQATVVGTVSITDSKDIETRRERDKGGVHDSIHDEPVRIGRSRVPLYTRRPGRTRQSLSRHVTDMDDTLEQPNPSSNLNTSSTRDEDREQDSSGDEDGGLDWTKLPYVHLPLDKVVA